MTHFSKECHLCFSLARHKLRESSAVAATCAAICAVVSLHGGETDHASPSPAHLLYTWVSPASHRTNRLEDDLSMTHHVT